MLSRPSAVASAIGLAVALLAAQPVAVQAQDPGADITLRKSFAPPSPGGGAGSAEGAGTGTRPSEDTGARPVRDEAAAPLASSARAAVEALGESLVSGGALHLPDVAGRDVVLDTEATPLVETAAGRRIILDPAGSIVAADAQAIARRWPAYRVVRPGRGGRALLDAVLGEAGYASVIPSTAVTFGRETIVRIAPDYVVLRRAADLLDGDTRALSVVETAADAIPAELREMAASHRILILDLLEKDASPVGGEPWRDPTGAVTTVGAAGPGLVLMELGAALGISVDPGEGDGTLRFQFGDASATARVRGRAAGGGAPGSGDEIAAEDTRRLSSAIGELLAALGIPAIGPSVELSRAAPPGKPRRFTITVPGWLVEARGPASSSPAPPSRSPCACSSGARGSTSSSIA